MVSLRPETRQVLEQVEATTERPVELVPDQNLSLIVTIQVARKGARSHVLRYNPSKPALDYFVVYQAGFVLRLFATPPETRADFVSTGVAWQDVAEMVWSEWPQSELESLQGFAQGVSQWALRNLRSRPIGMRIDQWIHDAYPDLVPTQMAGMTAVLEENIAILSARRGNVVMPSALLAPHAAYALFCERLINQTVYLPAFQAAGLVARGQRLLAIWDAIPDDPTEDRRLVDAWGEHLGMRNWYRWEPYIP